MKTKTRLLEIFDLLLKQYGPLHWWPAETPFEVCVGAILTQNTNWRNVEKAIANLKAAGIITAAAIRATSQESLAELIRPAGFFNVKSRRLKEFVDWLFARTGGDLEELGKGDWLQLREELLRVRGIGRETADSILLYALHKPSFVVDAYTRRLFAQAGFFPETTDYEEVRALFMKHLPADVALFNEYHALIVEHCKVHCRKKPRCEGCVMRMEGLCGCGGK